jgi:quercetin dioxygenase-like cupin family protein
MIHLRRLNRLLVLAPATFVLLILCATSIGFAAITPSLGLLADSNSVNEVNFNEGPIKLRTKDQVRVRVLHSGVTSGFNSGWHTHPGPVIVAVKQGTLSFIQGSCEPTMVSAGQAYIERPSIPILAMASGEAEWVATMIIPVGAPPATPADDPC